MGLVGFNPETVATSINSVKAAYSNLLSAIGAEVQDKFINAMADKWACEDAQTFFASVETTFNTLITDTNTTFQSVVEAMNSAANSWAQQTGGTWSSMQFDPINTKMNVSCIQISINGVKGVDPTAATEVANTSLGAVSENASTALQSAKDAVSDCGFIGGNTAATLNSSLTTIQNNINTAVTEISNSCKTAIQTTADNYTNLESSVNTAFSGSN